jgi:prophage antirepressor-like protein
MNDLTIFKNSRFGEVRTTVIDGKPYLLGKEVAEILGYKNTRDALLKHVDSEDKTTVAFRVSNTNYVSRAVFINESGVFSLIIRSNLPQAKDFKRWVTHEVLPAIRKTGGYIQVSHELTDEEIMERATKLADEAIKRREERLRLCYQ